MQYSIKLRNGQILRGFLNSPGEKSRANIVFVHGLGEHINRYTEWAESFARENIGFTGLDLPGHGASDGRRGHIQSFSLTDEMLDILLKHIKSTFPATPVFIYGHSLGGGIVLDYLLRKKPAVKGAVVTSPWLKLSVEPDKFKLALVSVMKSIIPGLVQPSGLVQANLSQDKDVISRYNSDPLVHDKISVSLAHNAMRAAVNSLNNSQELEVPLLLMHGSGDMICSLSGSSGFAAGTKQAELKIWDGGFHELHNEPFKNQVFEYIINWMTKVLPGSN